VRAVASLQPNRFSITLDEGKGRIHVVKDVAEGVMRVARIDVAEQRRGHGSKLYLAAAKLACAEYGMPLASDAVRTAASEGFWRKQLGRDRARCAAVIDERRCARYRFSCPAPTTLAGRRRRR
jgi:hypothetical protein